MITVERLLASALEHQIVLDSLREALTSNLVIANPYLLEIARFATEFSDKHHHLPRRGDWELWITSVPEARRPGVQQSLADLRRQSTDSITPEYLATTAVEALREVAAQNALARMNAIDINAETLQTLADEVSSIRPLTVQGLGRLAEPELWLRKNERITAWSTGVGKLDRFLGGGFTNELVFVLADSGVGKTTALINFAATAALNGANVLHITMELSTRNTLHRYYRRLAEATKADIAAETDRVLGRVRHWLRYAQGSVSVLFEEPYTLDPDKLRQLLRMYSRAEGKIDYLVLDYLDLMQGPKDVRNDYARLGRVSHSVRGMAIQEFECTAVSATQATKLAHGRRDLNLKHMGDSYEKVRAADLIIALAQDENEAKAFQARYLVLKGRESGKGLDIPLYANMDLMLIGSVDDVDVKRLMAQYGHLPARTLREIREEEKEKKEKEKKK